MTPPHSRTWRIVAAFGVVLIIAGLLIAGRGLWQYYLAHSAPVLTERRTVPLAAELGEIEQLPAAPPLRLDIPVIDLSLDVAAQPAAIDGQYTPPTADRAYWLADHGQAGSDATDTLYLLGHATLTGRAA
ncbi:MAG: hypothetical protein Q4Q03_08355, partial [Bowdeniella nasicola]|nr:hypothetical protein [Bowdeniella nasicola]